MASPDAAPTIFFYDEPEAAVAETMTTLASAIEKNPDTVSQAIMVSTLGSEAILKVLRFIDTHDDGSEVLKTWLQAFDDQMDIEVHFDDATEAAIQADPEFQRLHATKTDPTIRSSNIRRLRFNTYAKQMKKHKEAQANTNNVIPITDAIPSQHLREPA